MAVILVEKDALSGPTPINVFARLAAQVEELDPGEIGFEDFPLRLKKSRK
jgi:hypothetical protein